MIILKKSQSLEFGSLMSLMKPIIVDMKLSHIQERGDWSLNIIGYF